MLKTILLVISVLAFTKAQVPSLGWCPEYVPMANFDIAKFLGNWYEVERSLQLPELGSRCAMVSYTKGPDNKLHVSNIISRILGFQRVIEGEIILPSSKSEEGKLNLRYSTSLSNLPTNYHVLETDYKSYAVLWNCNSLGPVHTENLWIMTRNRLPSSETLQKAYAVLDKYKISKSYLITSDQTDCKYTGVETAAGTTPAVESEETEASVGEAPDHLRSSIIPNDTEEDDENQESTKLEESKAEPLKEEVAVTTNENEKNDKLPLPTTVAEVILKNVDNTQGKIDEDSKNEKNEKIAVIQPRIQPVVAAAELLKKPVGTANKEEEK